VKCMMCKGEILEGERYVTEHYKCSAEFHQALLKEIDELKLKVGKVMVELGARERIIEAYEAQLARMEKRS
jgi:hypothetical protein